jgi:SAM-dependent methyltransferase
MGMEESALIYRHPSYGVELRCARCRTPFGDQSRVCTTCGFVYREYEGRPVFISDADMARAQEEQKSDGENAFKNFFKRWPRAYRLLVYLVAPVLFSGLSAKKFVEQLSEPTERMLNVGSGSTQLHPKMLNVDIFPFQHVHILAQADALPFPDETFDVVVSEQMLEHVRRPYAVAKELERVTKKGGCIYTATPYMFPLHPSPKDYSRWSIDGLCELFDGCERVRAGILNGPVSGTLAVLAAGLATICSFGITPVRKVLHYAFMIVLSPIKLLDYLYARLPGAEDVAGGLWVVVRKTSSED